MRTIRDHLAEHHEAEGRAFIRAIQHAEVLRILGSHVSSSAGRFVDAIRYEAIQPQPLLTVPYGTKRRDAARLRRSHPEQGWVIVEHYDAKHQRTRTWLTTDRRWWLQRAGAWQAPELRESADMPPWLSRVAAAYGLDMPVDARLIDDLHALTRAVESLEFLMGRAAVHLTRGAPLIVGEG